MLGLTPPSARDHNASLSSPEHSSTDESLTDESLANKSLREQNAQLRQRIAELELQAQLQAQHEESMRSETESMRTANDYRQIMGRLVAAQEEERHRVSRELHDELGQHLTALQMGLNALPDFDADTMRAPSSNRRIEQLQELTSEMMQRVHQIAWELRPAALDDLGLEAALEHYIDRWKQRCPSVQLDFHARGFERVPPLDAALQTTFFRVIQESLTNVMRHANAQHASVVIERRDHQVIAIIEDNGCGFDVEATLQENTRLGLLGMRERLELVGGTLTIEAEPGSGTTVFARASVSFQEDETTP